MQAEPPPITRPTRRGLTAASASALPALVLLWLASTGALRGGALLLAAAGGLSLAALAWATFRLQPVAVRVTLLVAIAVSIVVVPQSLLLMTALRTAGANATLAIVLAVVGALLAAAAIGMIVACARLLGRTPPSSKAWWAACAAAVVAAIVLFVLWRVGEGFVAPSALDQIEVHELRFSDDGSEVTAASQYAATERIYSVRDGTFLRERRQTGRVARSETPYVGHDGALRLEVVREQRKVTALKLHDARGELRWTHDIGFRDWLARGSSCCLVSAVAFSPGDRLVAIAYFDNVYLYDAETGRVAARLDGPVRSHPTMFWWWDVLRLYRDRFK